MAAVRSTRRKIHQGALAVFARSGYAAAHMEAIAVAAGVAKGTLYYHYPAKDALYGDVLRAGLAELEGAIAQVHLASAGTPQDRLLHILDAHLRCFAANPGFCRLWFTHATGDIPLDAAVAELKAGYFERCVALVREFQQQGLLRTSLEPTSATAGLLGMLEHVVRHHAAQGDPLDGPAARQTLLAMGAGALGCQNELADFLLER